MCRNAVFYYTLCSCERGFVVWDASDPQQQDWIEKFQSESGSYPVHDCKDGTRYPLQRVEAKASEDCSYLASENKGMRPSERPCFERFGMKLELWVSMLRCERMDVQIFDEETLQITYRDPTQTFTPLFKHTARRRSSHPTTVVETIKGRDVRKDLRTEIDDESGTEKFFSATEERSERVDRVKAPRTAEENAARLKRVQKGTLLANQQAVDIDRRDQAQRDRRDSAVQEEAGRKSIALDEVILSTTTKSQFPEPLLSSPLIRPPVKLPGMVKATLPQRLAPPKAYSYTSLRYPPGYKEDPAIATEVCRCSEEKYTPRGQYTPNMTKYHTVAGYTRSEFAGFMPNQPLVSLDGSASRHSPQMTEGSKYHPISSILAPVAPPLAPNRLSIASQFSTYGSQQQLDTSNNSSRLRPVAPDFMPAQQQAELIGTESTNSKTMVHQSHLANGHSTRRRRRRK